MMTIGRTVLRMTTGALMAAHGLQKLNGSFGGPGIEGATKMMEQIGLHPARQHAMAAGITETVGGGLLAAGLLNPLGPAMVTGSMAVAVAKVHQKNGPWINKGGYEYNLTLAAVAFALAADGPGTFSLDALRGKQRTGLGWGLVELAMGIGAAAAVVSLADRAQPPKAYDGAAPVPAATAAPAGSPAPGTDGNGSSVADLTVESPLPMS